jgi:hypothetical protein
VNFFDGSDFFDSNQFGFLPRSTGGVTLPQYLSMSRRHSTVSTILYCSRNFFDVGFVGMDLKSFKIISLQGPKLFLRLKAKALQNS